MSRNLKDWINGYLEFNSSSEAPEAFLEWSAISTVAAVLQRKVWLQRGLYKTYPNLYILLVGPPATGKGIAMSPGRNLLAEIGISLSPQTLTKRALIDAFIECTIENVDAELAHSSLSLFSPEIATFFTNTDPDFIYTLTDIYDSGMASGGSWVDRTGAYGERVVPNIWFNLIGGTTKDTLHKLMNREIIDSGLASRIIFVYAGRKRHHIAFPELSANALNIENELLHDLFEIQALEGQFTMTHDYKEFYTKWYEKFDKPDNYPLKDKQFQDYCGRRGSLHIPKLALIVSASESSKQILDVCHFERALTMIEKIEELMPFVLGGMGSLGLEGHIMLRIKELVEFFDTVNYIRILSEFQNDILEWSLWNLVQTTCKVEGYLLQPVVEDKSALKKLYGLVSDKDLIRYITGENYKRRELAVDWVIKKPKEE